jgi:hypothetical protein
MEVYAATLVGLLFRSPCLLVCLVLEISLSDASFSEEQGPRNSTFLMRDSRRYQGGDDAIGIWYCSSTCGERTAGYLSGERS